MFRLEELLRQFFREFRDFLEFPENPEFPVFMVSGLLRFTEYPEGVRL
jgi:hypothetical protein